MASWVPSETYHRAIIDVLAEAREAIAHGVELLPLDVYRALPPAERKWRWFANWEPWLPPRFGLAWGALLDTLEDGQWHRANDVRQIMVDASGIGWRATYIGLWQAVQAGVIEEHRVGGSCRLVDRRIRLRADAPARLLQRPLPKG